MSRFGCDGRDGKRTVRVLLSTTVGTFVERPEFSCSSPKQNGSSEVCFLRRLITTIHFDCHARLTNKRSNSVGEHGKQVTSARRDPVIFTVSVKFKFNDEFKTDKTQRSIYNILSGFIFRLSH